VTWADQIIEEMPQPPIELIELSLSRADHEPLDLLERLAANADPKALLPALSEFRQHISTGMITLRDAIGRMQRFARRHGNGVGDEMSNFLVWADDEYDLIEEGMVHGTHERLRLEFEDELRRAAAET
jgi:hypothetical protein